MNTPELVRPAASGAGTPVSPSNYSDKWERMWSAGISEGQFFDAKRSAPCLAKMLGSRTGQKFVVGKSAVVPGCGRGYDLITLSELGAKRVVGLELSDTAVCFLISYGVKPVAVAEQFVAGHQIGVGRQVQVVAGDWLLPDVLDEEFDVGYDYTFFCALHPGMREDWADGWARRMKQGGTLLALCFPVTPIEKQGPPWPVTVEDYEALLIPRGFVCIGIEPIAEAEATTPARAGMEILTIWMKS